MISKLKQCFTNTLTKVNKRITDFIELKQKQATEETLELIESIKEKAAKLDRIDSINAPLLDYYDIDLLRDAEDALTCFIENNEL